MFLASGETCGRDAAGNATCNGQYSAQDVTASGTGIQVPTAGNTAISNPGATASSSGTTTRTGTGPSTGSATTTPTSTGTGTTTAHASSTTSSSGSVAGFTAPQVPIAVLGFMASLILFVST